MLTPFAQCKRRRACGQEQADRRRKAGGAAGDPLVSCGGHVEGSDDRDARRDGTEVLVDEADAGLHMAERVAPVPSRGVAVVTALAYREVDDAVAAALVAQAVA